MLEKLARYLLRNDRNFQRLDKLLDDYKNWTWDVCVMRHSSGIELWISNGFSHFDVYKPYEIKFSYLMKKALWGKTMKLRKRKDSFLLENILDEMEKQQEEK